MSKRIGVYICQCGSNIADYVDVQTVREEISKQEEVTLSRVTMFACSDSSQKEIIADIKNEPLDAIVVASCSPKLHLSTFRGVAERAGLNRYNYVQVNIREQCSWAHSDQPDQATFKAIELIRAGIARVSLAEPLIPLKIPAENAVAIFGAGVVGMRAAIELSDLGTKVYLVEKAHFIGGRVAQWGKMSMTDQNGNEIIAKLFERIKNRDTLQLFTGAHLVSSRGSIGNFELQLKIVPRYVRAYDDPRGLRKAMEACPVSVDDDFNFKLQKRKALIGDSENLFPSLPAIDMAACSRCGECLKYYPGIDLDQKEETETLKVGSVLVTTGFDPYEPVEGEYGYNEYPDVITLQQLMRLMDLYKGKKFPGTKKIEHVAFIYCVGSRQPEGGNQYCARYCCTSAIRAAIQLREEFNIPYIYHLNKGIRTYGKQEILYDKSSRSGDIYLQFVDDDPPVVNADDDRVMITVNDLLTANQQITLKADLVVLVTGMVPRNNPEISGILKIPAGRDKFYNEVHPKLRPVETVLDGIYIAGCCQGPKNAHESVSSGLAAVSKIFASISKGEIQIEPTLAIVNPAACLWCGQCLEACPFDAIEKVDKEGRVVARIIESNCKGCGMCTPVCPAQAIDIKGFTDMEIRSMIEAMSG